MNTQRVLKLIRESIEKMQLNLSGYTVLTEAATGYYAATAGIAAMAGARVMATANDSAYGTADDAIEQVKELAQSIEGKIEITYHKVLKDKLINAADIITNLGFVRPIDKAFVDRMKPGAVISLMCEPWEVRPEDVNLKYLKEKGIPALGTNEDAIGLQVFDYTKPLLLKMLFDAGLEVYGNRYIVLSGDKFGDRICQALQANGADVTLCKPDEFDISKVSGSVDGVIVADYTEKRVIIGNAGLIKPDEIAKAFPGVRIIQFAGKNDIASIKAAGLSVYPDRELQPMRMAHTFSYLGPKPVIELHAAGLKVGQELADAMSKTGNAEEAKRIALQNPVCADFE